MKHIKIVSLFCLTLIAASTLHAEQTLALIKPDGVYRFRQRKILKILEQNNFTVLSRLDKTLTEQEAKAFYQEHADKPFFNDLITLMTSGRSIFLLLEKENAVAEWRALVGATDPSRAKDGTIRQLYGKDVRLNCVHGSDSVESALREIALIFGETVQDAAEETVEEGTVSEEAATVTAEELIVETVSEEVQTVVVAEKE